MPKQPSRIKGKPSPSSSKGNVTKRTVTRKKKIGSGSKKRNQNQQYGTSKLETYFATEFLDKLGIDYIYEYEAKPIKRFYDFAIVRLVPKTPRLLVEENGITSLDQVKCYYRILALCEVNGGYWHGDPRLLTDGKLSRMQQHNQFVDGLKESWCTRNNIPLLIFWEKDIREDPKSVMDTLKAFMSSITHEEERNRKISGPHLSY